MPREPDSILHQLLTRFEGAQLVEAWGERSVFCNPGGILLRGVSFATVKARDGAGDRASGLDRAGVFRLNVGTARPLFMDRFGPPPARPGKGGVVAGPWDFTALDGLTPHPVYGWMNWVCALNPSEATLSQMQEMIAAAHAKAAFDKKTRQDRPCSAGRLR